MVEKFLRWHDVEAVTGLSRTTVWREIRAGRFPASVALTAKTVGWRESEVRAWMESRGQQNAA